MDCWFISSLHLDIASSLKRKYIPKLYHASLGGSHSLLVSRISLLFHIISHICQRHHRRRLLGATCCNFCFFSHKFWVLNIGIEKSCQCKLNDKYEVYFIFHKCFLDISSSWKRKYIPKLYHASLGGRRSMLVRRSHCYFIFHQCFLDISSSWKRKYIP